MTEKIANQVFYLGGISGTGKTSITTEVSHLMPKIEPMYSSKKLMQHFGYSSYDDLNNTDEDKQIKARESIYSRLILGKQGKIYLADGHYVLFGQGDYHMQCIEKSWANGIAAFFHITTDPKLILERISLDSSNLQRRIDNLAQLESESKVLDRIKLSQDISIKAAIDVSSSLQKKLFIVKNDNNLVEAAETVLSNINSSANNS